MNRRFVLAAGALCAAAACFGAGIAHAQSSAAPTFETAGVKFAPTVQLGGSNLVLNGAGLRYKFVVKVYAAALYLAGKATTPEAVLAAPGPKRMHVVMLRDIDGNELGKLFTRGMQDNAPREEFSKSIPGTLRMAEVFSARKRLKEGDSFFIDWIPGTGTQVVINGKAEGAPIAEPEFFTALMRIWLGANPADDALKSALLGQPRVSARDASR
jgi:hypothetical protein